MRRSTSRAQMSETVTGDASSNQFILQGPLFAWPKKVLLPYVPIQYVVRGPEILSYKLESACLCFFVAPRHPGLFAMTRWGTFIANVLPQDWCMTMLSQSTVKRLYPVCPAKHAGRFNLLKGLNLGEPIFYPVSGAGHGSRASQWLVPPSRCQCGAVRPFPGTATKNKKTQTAGADGEQFEDVGWKSESVDDGWIVPGWMMQCLDHV